jgi:hypothetical protein
MKWVQLESLRDKPLHRRRQLAVQGYRILLPGKFGEHASP